MRTSPPPVTGIPWDTRSSGGRAPYQDIALQQQPGLDGDADARLAVPLHVAAERDGTWTRVAAQKPHSTPTPPAPFHPSSCPPASVSPPAPHKHPKGRLRAVAATFGTGGCGKKGGRAPRGPGVGIGQLGK